MKYVILHGLELMQCDEKGMITRPEIGVDTPSKDWYITGAVKISSFGNITRKYSLDETLNGNLQWWYNNGKQKIHITDYDHGTHRIWMKPGHKIIPKS